MNLATLFTNKWALTILATLLAVQAQAVNWVSRHGMSSSEFQSEFNIWTGSPYNYKLISISGYEESGQEKFAAVWEYQPGPGWITHPGMSKSQFDSLNATYNAQGFQPVFISGYGVGGQARYNAIWDYLPGIEIEEDVGLSYSNYVTRNREWTAKGYALIHLWTCNAGSTELFTAIWKRGGNASYEERTRLTATNYQQQFNDLSSQGFQLIAVSAAMVGGQPLYSGIWKSPGSGDAWYSFADLSAVNYQGQSWNWEHQGYRPVFISSFVKNGTPRFNVTFYRNGGFTPSNLQTIDNAISGYMTSNNVPGLSLAISRDGDLVYAKGFGNADVGAGEMVHPHHRFRIASVSKTLTSAAVMKLRDHCGLELGDTVFGPGSILGNQFGSSGYSAREQSITVRHLLQHSTGWRVDGIWQVSGSNPDDAIDWQIDNHEPAAAPGTTYQYMNVDYASAGRVIETLSGRSYEQFVQDELLGPSCVTQMEIGGNSLAQRKPGEVVYYGSNPYGLDPARMDAHGGWIARPIDLLLFMRRIDGNAANADLLTTDSWNQMQTTSMASTNSYALGVFPLNGGSAWGHNGSMDGTIAYLVYRNDGMAYAFTCNSTPPNDPFAGGLRGVVDGIVNTLNAAGAWPSYDLFPCDVPPGSPPSGLANGPNLYVDGGSSCVLPSGNQNCIYNGIFWVGGPRITVVDALNAAHCGTRLFIRAGTYDETVTFDLPMTVRSYDGSAYVGQ